MEMRTARCSWRVIDTDRSIDVRLLAADSIVVPLSEPPRMLLPVIPASGDPA